MPAKRIPPYLKIAIAAVGLLLLAATQDDALLFARDLLHPEYRPASAGPPDTGVTVSGVTRFNDIAYGRDPRQRFDVYVPAEAQQAPILVMVHGGAWKSGDKTSPGVVGNKADYWLAKGFVFISVNYRMRPDADPLTQADDVAAALAFIQKKAATWDGDAARIILMGHSAGAHLVAVLSADPSLAARAGAARWSGSVALDSAAFNIAPLMEKRHFAFYDEAFGSDPAYWRAASPLTHITPQAVPMLLVCSSLRRDSCPQAEAFAAAARAQGDSVTVHAERLSHMDINHLLGLPGAYTQAVYAFIASHKAK